MLPGLRRTAPGLTKDLRPTPTAASVPARCAGGDPLGLLAAIRRRHPARRLRGRRLRAARACPAFTRSTRDGGLDGRRDRLLRRDARVHGRLGAHAARRARRSTCSLALAAAVAIVLLWRRRPDLASVARAGRALRVRARRLRRRALDEAERRRGLRLAAPLGAADARVPRARRRAQQARRVGLRLRALARSSSRSPSSPSRISAATRPGAAGSACSLRRSGPRGRCSSA